MIINVTQNFENQLPHDDLSHFGRILMYSMRRSGEQVSKKNQRKNNSITKTNFVIVRFDTFAGTQTTAVTNSFLFCFISHGFLFLLELLLLFFYAYYNSLSRSMKTTVWWNSFEFECFRYFMVGSSFLLLVNVSLRAKYTTTISMWILSKFNCIKSMPFEFFLILYHKS